MSVTCLGVGLQVPAGFIICIASKRLKRTKVREALPAFKRRRLERQETRGKHQVYMAVKEGPSYETGVGFSTEEHHTVDRIPDATPEPQYIRCSDTPMCQVFLIQKRGGNQELVLHPFVKYHV